MRAWRVPSYVDRPLSFDVRRRMAQWSQRRPWRVLLRFSILPAFVIGLCIALPILLATLPFAILYTFVEMRISRAIGLSRRGYFGGRLGRGNWIYEELHDGSLRILTLKAENTEPGRWELFLPADELWRTTVPDWAKDRREEIALRIATRLKAKRLHFPADLRNGRSGRTSRPSTSQRAT
jgi:hypothetical protein